MCPADGRGANRTKLGLKEFLRAPFIGRAGWRANRTKLGLKEHIVVIDTISEFARQSNQAGIERLPFMEQAFKMTERQSNQAGIESRHGVRSLQQAEEAPIEPSWDRKGGHSQGCGAQGAAPIEPSWD